MFTFSRPASFATLLLLTFCPSLSSARVLYDPRTAQGPTFALTLTLVHVSALALHLAPAVANPFSIFYFQFSPSTFRSLLPASCSPRPTFCPAQPIPHHILGNFGVLESLPSSIACLIVATTRRSSREARRLEGSKLKVRAKSLGTNGRGCFVSVWTLWFAFLRFAF